MADKIGLSEKGLENRIASLRNTTDYISQVCSGYPDCLDEMYREIANSERQLAQLRELRAEKEFREKNS